MGVKVKHWKGAYWVFINHEGKRKAKRVGEGKTGKRAAELAAVKIQARLAQGDSSLLDETESPRPLPPTARTYPHLRDALPEWIDRKARAGDIRGESKRIIEQYRRNRKRATERPGNDAAP